MNKVCRCPITYNKILSNQKYSQQGLSLLSPKLNNLIDLPYTASMQRHEALQRAHKMSIQGVQPKLSAKLSIKNNCFEIVDYAGKFILKPQHDFFLQAPENESLSMNLAKLIGIEVPHNGLIYCIDNQLTYFIKRFDRTGHNNKISVEDFAQLTGKSRDTKYSFSMEKLIPVIENHCSFPLIEKAKLFRRTIFNFLIGNEDMHLKNFSLIIRNKKVELAPAYDFINSTIIMGSAKEEIALPLNGKKNNLTKKDFVNYFGSHKLQLPQKIIQQELTVFTNNYQNCLSLISNSFLDSYHQEKYRELFIKRYKTIIN